LTTNIDVIFLGTGSAAQNVAYTCRASGWSVAVVDSRPFGGTCALRGCDPKKVLVGVAELVDWSRRMQGKGVCAPGLSLNWPDLIRFKRTFTDPVPEGTEHSFAEAGITMRHGRAHFIDRTAVQVGDDILLGRHVVIATGARHARLRIAGEELLTTSTQFLELEELPPRVAFVGGGYIAFEFAHIAARAGARVQVLHRGARPLTRFDPDLVSQLMQATRELGVEIHLNMAVTAIEQQGDHLLIHAGTGAQEHTVEADLVVHAAGRVPELDDLELEAAGVSREKEGVLVNEYLQSVTNEAGDAVASGGFPLTPVAGMQGGIVARNLLEDNRHTQRGLHDSPSGPRGPARGSGSRAGFALYDAPRGHLKLVFLAAGGLAAHRLQGARRGRFRAHPGGAPLGLACRGDDQPLRLGHAHRAACDRSQADGLRLPHERLGHQLHGLRTRTGRVAHCLSATGIHTTARSSLA
jgi:glutathione reductase (NADPH)